MKTRLRVAAMVVIPTAVVAFLLVASISSATTRVTHPVSAQYQENPAPRLVANSDKAASAFLQEQQIRSLAAPPSSGVLRSVLLMKWGDHVRTNLVGKPRFYEVSDDRMVWVVKEYLPDGIRVKGEIRRNVDLTLVFDAETGDLIFTQAAGHVGS